MDWGDNRRCCCTLGEVSRITTSCCDHHEDEAVMDALHGSSGQLLPSVDIISVSPESLIQDIRSSLQTLYVHCSLAIAAHFGTAWQA